MDTFEMKTISDGKAKERYRVSFPLTSSYVSPSIYPPQHPFHSHLQLYFYYPCVRDYTAVGQITFYHPHIFRQQMEGQEILI